jgi:hypothetical protein
VKHVLLGLLLGLAAAFPAAAGQGAAPILAAFGWLLAQPAVCVAAAGWVLVKGLRARSWPVRATGRKGGAR